MSKVSDLFKLDLSTALLYANLEYIKGFDYAMDLVFSVSFRNWINPFFCLNFSVFWGFICNE